MAIGANSYGTVLGVAALSPRYTIGGTFTTASRPKLEDVENWIDELSALLNGYLAGMGFSIPMTQSDILLSLRGFVNEEVKDFAEGVNGAGRFGPQTETLKYRSRQSIINGDIEKYLKGTAAGWERLGATRTVSLLGNVGYLRTTNSGGAVFPMFTRESFGGDTFTEEDAA